MTARLFLKALRLLWPYLRSAIFRDRTVAEVIHENLHITMMLGLIILLTIALAMTTLKLSELKATRRVVPITVAEVPPDCTPPFNIERLLDLLREP